MILLIGVTSWDISVPLLKVDDPHFGLWYCSCLMEFDMPKMGPEDFPVKILSFCLGSFQILCIKCWWGATLTETHPRMLISLMLTRLIFHHIVVGLFFWWNSMWSTIYKLYLYQLNTIAPYVQLWTSDAVGSLHCRGRLRRYGVNADDRSVSSWISSCNAQSLLYRPPVDPHVFDLVSVALFRTWGHVNKIYRVLIM